MKSILMSIKPKYVAKILNGDKTIEVRKRFPKDYKGWVYIYCTKDTKGELHYSKQYGAFYDIYKGAEHYSENGNLNGKVVARFYCDNVEEIKFHCLTKTNTYGVQRIETTFTTQTLSFAELKKISCLTGDDLMKYLNDTDGYAIHISQLEIFYKPKELSDFKICRKCLDYNAFIPLDKAPQSYMFIEEVEQ